MASRVSEALSTTSSGRPGRVNDEIYAEALTTVHEMQSLVSDSQRMITGVTDRIEGMLIEHLEAVDLQESSEREVVASKASEEPSSRFAAKDPISSSTQYEQLEDDEEANLPPSSSITSLQKLWQAYCMLKFSEFWLEMLQVTAVTPLMLVAVSCCLSLKALHLSIVALLFARSL